MFRFAGRFLLFHTSGKFLGSVKFENMGSIFKEEKLKLICNSDNVRFFVFEGPARFDEKKKEKEEASESKKKEEKAGQRRAFYIFKLVQ